jgi:hypothetical protein
LLSFPVSRGDRAELGSLGSSDLHGVSSRLF